MAMLIRILGIGIIIIICVVLAVVVYWASLLINVNSIVSQLDCLKVPDDNIVELGSGIQSSYQPYYITDHNYTSIELFSSSGHRCKLRLKAIGQNTTIYDVYQASATTVYLRQKDAHQGIIRVNISTCSSKKVYKIIDGKRTGDGWDNLDNLIQYEDGFDEIVQIDNAIFRVSYDFDGNQIGQPKVFHLEYMPSWVKTISSKSRSSNLVIDYYEQGPSVKTIKRFISLVDADGRLIKHLLEFEFAGYNELVDDVGDSSYAYCRRRSRSIECVQFDELGNEKYRNTTKNDFELIAVYNLKISGVVLFTGTYGRHGEQLNVIEMRSGKVRESSYFLAKKFHGNIFVTNFSEADRQFSIRTESRVSGLSNYCICRNTISLPN